MIKQTKHDEIAKEQQVPRQKYEERLVSVKNGFNLIAKKRAKYVM